MLSSDELTAVASAQPPDVGEAVGTGGTMIYTSGTTGKPKGAVRYATDQETGLALITLIGYRPDDIYITSGPLYHSGPGAFMGIGLLFGQTIVVQRKFDAEDWLRLVDKYKVTSTFSAPGADPDGVRAAGRGQGEVRPVLHAGHDRQRGAVELRAQAAVRGRLPAGVAVGGLRLDRARRGLRPRARGPDAQARLLRPAGARHRDRAVRRGRQRRDRHRARASGRAVRPVQGRVQRVLQAAGQLRRGQPRRLPHRRRHRLPGRRGLPTTSATARTT